MSGQAGPGWYPDGAGGERWWDGQQWTDQSRPAQAPPGQFGQPGQPGQWGQPGQPGQWGQPGQPPKKKRGGLIALVAALVALVLIGGGVASYFVWFRDSDDDPRRDDETSAEGPEDVAVDYTAAYATLDFRTMCELTSTDGRDDLYGDFDASDATDCDDFDDAASAAYDELLGDGGSDVFGDYADIDELRDDLSDNGRFVPGDVEVVEGDPEVDDEVKVRVPGTYEYDGDNPEIDAENDDEIVLDLVREGDEWRVEGVDATYDADGGSSDDSGSSDDGSSDEGAEEPAEPSEEPTAAASPDAAGAPEATEEAASALLAEIAAAAQGNDWETICDNSSQGMQLYNFSFFDVEDCAGVADAAGDRNWAEVAVRSLEVPEAAGEGDTATATLAHTSSAGAPGQQEVTLVVESGEWRLDTDLIPS